MRKQLYVCFAMPGVPIFGSGGTKIIYKLVEQFASHGISVGVLFADRNTWLDFLLRNQKKKLPFMKTLLRMNDSHLGYLLLNPIVKKILRIPHYGSVKGATKLFGIKKVSDYDIRYLVATNFAIARDLMNTPSVGERTILFSQVDETDENYSDGYDKRKIEEVYSEVRYKIFLNESIASRYQGSKVTNIGIDQNLFKLTHDIDERDGSCVLFQLKQGKQKGVLTALRAMDKIHNLDSKAKVIAFGNLPKHAVPYYAEYHRNPSNSELVALMNDSAIFVITSKIEGTPAPPLEAMSCGCAVVSTDNIGIRRYLVNGQNGILVDVDDAEAVAEAVLKLMNDNELRRRIAINGYSSSRVYSYERMFCDFKEILEQF